MGPLPPPLKMPRGCLNPQPTASRRHLAEQPRPCSLAVQLPALAPHLRLSSWPPPAPPPSPPSFLQHWCLFSEPWNPSQASDIYSLESEYFLFLFPRARLLGEISPRMLPAFLEAKCGEQSWLMSAQHQVYQSAIIRHPLHTRPFS